MNYIFGAAFDPITKAHLSIIKSIKKMCKSDDELYVLVSNTDEKNYQASIDERIKLVENTLHSALNDFSTKVLEQNRRTYYFLQDAFNKSEPVTIVIGEDEWLSLTQGKWANYQALLNTYSFIVVGRFKDKTYKLGLANIANTKVTYITVENTDDVSSSKVREIFYRNPATKYSDVKTYIAKFTFEMIKENEMYKQNSEHYVEKETEFLKQYAIMKKENGWGDPSVTVDIVAHNGDKVLLIRRGNYPYKNYWALPGGFFNAVNTTLKTGEVITADPDIDYAAAREFEEETTIKINHSKFYQIKTYAHMFDPRCRIVDVAFDVRVNAKDMKKATGADDAIEAKWFDINDLPAMAFHHEQIIKDYMKTNIIEVCNE